MSQRPFIHPHAVTRRAVVQAGAIGILGLGANHVRALRAADIVGGPVTAGSGRAKAVIYLFLSGGLAQQDSFDMKPEAPADIRGEFMPIDTATPGMQICEHLPLLAQRSRHWSLVRSLTHPSNDHSLGHHIMMTGRCQAPPTFNANKPSPQDWPCIASVVGDQTLPRNNLPPAVSLPERLIHRTGRVLPGQFAGEMGPRRDPWFINAAPFNGETYGAFPEYEFFHAGGPKHVSGLKFQAPNLSLPEGLVTARMERRMEMLRGVESQRRHLDELAAVTAFDGDRQAAVSLLLEPRVKTAFDVTSASDAEQDRYGRNSFGWSLLMARRLVGAGVNMVQVNLGNNETWDTHGDAFPNLKDSLFPPTDRAISALLDDLSATGELDETLIVMAGEFGRTPKITHLPQHYKLPGRDHWGAVQSVWFAGGGIQGGRVIGVSDKSGGYPISDPQSPENMAATIYDALGLPATAAWHDDQNRPHQVYYGEPIAGLT